MIKQCSLKCMQMEASCYLQGLLTEKRTLLGEQDSFCSSSYADAFSTIRRKSPVLKGIVLSAQEIAQLNAQRRFLLCVQFIRMNAPGASAEQIQAGTSNFLLLCTPLYPFDLNDRLHRCQVCTGFIWERFMLRVQRSDQSPSSSSVALLSLLSSIDGII